MRQDLPVTDVSFIKPPSNNLSVIFLINYSSIEFMFLQHTLVLESEIQRRVGGKRTFH